MNPRVAFQGERGAFSEEGAQVLFNNEVETVPCATFELLFSAVKDGRADYVLSPLENSLAGHVTRCYDLLYESDLSIHAEVVRPIHHCLIGVPGARIDTLKAVQSHPVALAQCEAFFVSNPQIKRIVAEDTAGSVREVMERGDRTVAAIAGSHAASAYNASVLRSNVEDFPENFTRFALLGPRSAEIADANKYSLAVKLRHESGSLYHALEPFARHGINLANLLCRPIKRSPWQYLFFLDFLAAPSEATQSALQQLRNMAEEVRVLGSYRAAAANI
ncbi:MAG: prephenate dehydratase [Terriglobia bacterium]|nr:prephenate dehydratase [Terriglobia bacterium]